MSWFTDHNYVHEPLHHDDLKKIMDSGDPIAIKIALYALTLEGTLHAIEDHKPPDGWDAYKWARAQARWAIDPEFCKKPPDGSAWE
jgi:hypothetical protein